MIDLVDGDDDSALGRLGVAQRFERLRHHAVIRGDDEHDDVRDVRAARAHGTERGVAGRVEESDLLQARSSAPDAGRKWCKRRCAG